MNYTRKSIIVKCGVVFVIIASSLLNGHLQMNRKANKVLELMIKEEHSTSIFNDLNMIDTQVYYMLRLAKKNGMNQTYNLKKLDELHQDYNEMNEEIKDIDEEKEIKNILKGTYSYYHWFIDTKNIILAVTHDMKSQKDKMSEDDFTHLLRYEDECKNRIRIIQKSDYYIQAVKWEEDTSGLLAQLIKKITGGKKV